MQRESRLDRAAVIDAARQIGIGDRRQIEAAGDAIGRFALIVGMAGDELDLGNSIGGEFDLQRETGGRIEAPQLAFIVRLAPAPRANAGRVGERALADEARARILIADETDAVRARPRREKPDLAATGARRAQQPVARENRIERLDEKRLDMHAGKIEISGIGARFVLRDFGEAGHAQLARAPGFVGEQYAPGDDRLIPVRRDSHPRLKPADFIDESETVAAGLLDAIAAGAPHRFIADRPGRRALLADIKKTAARL